MKVISSLGKTRFKKTAMAIGVFDGMHRGHQLLINSAIKQSKRLKAKSLVITFFPHPAHVLSKNRQLPYLMTLEHRLTCLKNMGVDVVWVVPFSKRFAKINPYYFIKEILVNQLGAKTINVGANFRFGKDREGDVALIKSLAKESGYQTFAHHPIISSGKIISSGRLREIIPNGKLKEAKQLLGRHFSLNGKVTHGDGRGQGLGFPTANIDYNSDVLPPLGVYAVRILWKGKVLKGMANLGLRPTFRKTQIKPLLEVNIFDFKKNIYGQVLEIEFLKKIRSEMKFSSPEELINQINKDLKQIRLIFS